MRGCRTTLFLLAGWASLSFAEDPPCGPPSNCGKGLLGKCCASYKGISCYQPPAPEPCICDDPCTKRGRLCLPWYSSKTAALLEQLQDCHYRCRAEAAKKLGSRLCTDYCCHPEIVPALVHTLQCDSCWVVRRAAARALGYQVAANQCVWTALFLASRLDPHYLVRDEAADALAIVQTQISLGCIREYREAAEAFEKAVKGHYKPGKPGCELVYPPFCDGCPPGCPGVPITGPIKPK